MTGVYQVPSVILKGDCAVKLDLANNKLYYLLKWHLAFFCSAYYHVHIRASHQKFLRFLWKGKVYQFLVLCFGLKTVGCAKSEFSFC